MPALLIGLGSANSWGGDGAFSTWEPLQGCEDLSSSGSLLDTRLARDAGSDREGIRHVPPHQVLIEVLL